MLQARSVNNCSRPRLRLLTHLPAVQIPVSSDAWKKPQGPALFFLLDVFTVGNTSVFSWRSDRVWGGFKVNVLDVSANCSHHQLRLSTPSTPLAHSCHYCSVGKGLERLVGEAFRLQQSHGPLCRVSQEHTPEEKPRRVISSSSRAAWITKQKESCLALGLFTFLLRTFPVFSSSFPPFPIDGVL